MSGSSNRDEESNAGCFAHLRALFTRRDSHRKLPAHQGDADADAETDATAPTSPYVPQHARTSFLRTATPKPMKRANDILTDILASVSGPFFSGAPSQKKKGNEWTKFEHHFPAPPSIVAQNCRKGLVPALYLNFAPLPPRRAIDKTILCDLMWLTGVGPGDSRYRLRSGCLHR
ncbi:hypothetical protein F5Y15DRAFT_412537 [Xylariaceae sp. FL0016]|nr:hypothetical protein F5Y15DRAFT_412537 [Xylariaceae sp. FL0016]